MYEYKTKVISDRLVIEDNLNQMAKKGWELYKIAVNILIFRRKIQKKPGRKPKKVLK